MHTVLVILGGFLLLGLSLLAGRLIGGQEPELLATIAKLFIPFWCGCALLNMWMGVNEAGYSVADELPVLLLVLAVPSAVAVYVWRRLS